MVEPVKREPVPPVLHSDFDDMRRRGRVLIVLYVIATLVALATGVIGHVSTGLLLWGATSTVLLGLCALMWRDLLHEDERKAKRIRDRDFRYRQTLALMPQGVTILREDWSIEWVNEAAGRHLGIMPEDIGKLLFDVVRDERMRRWLFSREFEKPLVMTPEGSPFILEFTAVAPDLRHTMIVSHDVTERRRLDDMRRDFVANVSHELRTPLTVIGGFLDMECEKGSVPEEMIEYHRSLMREQTRRMKSILDDLLTLSKLENKDEGAAPEEPEVVAMPKLVEDVVREGRALSMGRHEITCEVEDVSVIGYADELRSAVMNLVSNAVRYTPQGGTVAVTWKRVGTGAVLAVKDTGIGIDPKHIPRLTERFYRVDKGRSRSVGGTGLGLAIVKHTVRRNGATLEIESAPGKGSTFSMRFPEGRTFQPLY